MTGGLILSAVVATIISLFVGLSAKTAVHEIEAMVLALIAATFWTGGAIVRAIHSLGPAPARSEVVAPATVPPESPSVGLG